MILQKRRSPRGLALALFGLAVALGVLAAGADARDNADSAFEKDRQAILAMEGNYKVGFNFRETVPLAEGYELKDPYVTGGSEIVRVIEDDTTFISLQHILVVGEDEPMAVKHWRQDWVYEPKQYLDYVGDNRWQNRKVSRRDRRGAWLQVVYQVDDSPRYAAVARWRHDANVSSWQSPPTWRPLPRRDSTTRDDYDVIVAVNRHTITPAGWAHEQDNTKLKLDGGQPTYLVREVGINTYEKFDDFDIATAERYWAATADFWRDVRQAWSRVAARSDSVTIRQEIDDKVLWERMFELAGPEQGDQAPTAGAKEIAQVLDAYLAVQ